MNGERVEFRLGDVACVKHGYAFPGDGITDEPTRDVLVTPGNFEVGGGFKMERLKYYRGEVPEEYLLAPGDLVVTMTDLSKVSETLGYSALIPRNASLRFLHNQRVGRVEVTRPDLVDTGFLYWLLRTPEYRAEVLAGATGTGVKHTAPRRIEAFRFLAPGLEEQREMCVVLNALDARIEVNQRMSDTLMSLMQGAFRSWFVDLDPVRSNAAGRSFSSLIDPHAVGLFPAEMRTVDGVDVPDGWCTRSLYESATYINGAAFRDFKFTEDPNNGLPIVKIAELKNGVTSQTKFTTSVLDEKYRLADGDILFSWSGNPDTSIDIFVWHRGPAWLNQHIFKVVPRRPHERVFAFLLLKSLKPTFAEIARNKQTTGLGHVTAHDMKRLSVIVPPGQVIEAFNVFAEPLFDRWCHNLREEQALSKLRDVLIPRLVSGSLRVERSAADFEAVA